MTDEPRIKINTGDGCGPLVLECVVLWMLGHADELESISRSLREIAAAAKAHPSINGGRVLTEASKAGGEAMSKEQVYDAEIGPLMTRIIAICKRAGISCFCTFDVSPEVVGDEGALLCTTCLADEKGSLSDAVRNAHDAVFRHADFMAFTITKAEVKP